MKRTFKKRHNKHIIIKREQSFLKVRLTNDMIIRYEIIFMSVKDCTHSFMSFIVFLKMYLEAAR